MTNDLTAIFIICFYSAWSVYAAVRQVQLYGWSWWKVPVCAVLNFALCPLCMITAFINWRDRK